MIEVASGLVAGAALGVVLQGSGLCSRATVVDALAGRTELARGWLLGVVVAGFGLAVLYLLPGTDDLNRGLPFRPVANLVGGLLIGCGMVVARSCVSGLFYKLGTGMLGALVGLVGWGGGELVARHVTLPGPTTLHGGVDGTLPGVLGLPRLLVAGVVLVVVLVLLRRRGLPAFGLALGAVVVLGWALAAIGGSSFGPSSVGAVVSVSDGHPNGWLISFLAGVAAGGFASALRRHELEVRGETGTRYVGLAIGGFLLGAGGWIAGGCTIGHGLSGTAQLNIASWYVVAAIVLGVVLTGRLARITGLREPA
ncbi:MAG: YeeE/YedE thiosulfate transporter family protein [Marmoricola sp.]